MAFIKPDCGSVTAITLLIHPKQGQILPSIPFFLLLGLLAGRLGDEVGTGGMSTGGVGAGGVGAGGVGAGGAGTGGMSLGAHFNFSRPTTDSRGVGGITSTCGTRLCDNCDPRAPSSFCPASGRPSSTSSDLTCGLLPRSSSSNEPVS
jgi:hypothetical protein